MNSVALPASAASSALDAESDLVRQAARGSADAFGELYRRHSQMSWRLAQAVALDAASAVESVGGGFARALRLSPPKRSGESSEATFRTTVLAAVYRGAANDAREAEITPRARPKGQTAEAAFAEAAFRSLPARWRAAVWLSEVEAMDTQRIAAVLGVSVAVATQLVTRGRRGLVGRYGQGHHAVPDQLGPALRSIALAEPADLAAVTRARWASAGSSSHARLSPVAGWLEERAIRPLWVSVGGLLGLGMIGLGIVGPAVALRTDLGANGASTSAGAIPVHTCYGVPCGAGSGPAAAGGAYTAFSPTLTAATGAGQTLAADTTAGSTASTPSTGGSGLSATPANAAGSSATTPAVNNPGTGGQPGGSTSAMSTSTTVVDAAPVGSVTKSGSSYQVNVAPTTGGSVASVTVNCSTPVGLTIGSTQVGCGSPTVPPSVSNPASAATTATNTAGSAASSATSAVTTTVQQGAATVNGIVQNTGL